MRSTVRAAPRSTSKPLIFFDGVIASGRAEIRWSLLRRGNTRRYGTSFPSRSKSRRSRSPSIAVSRIHLERHAADEHRGVEIQPLVSGAVNDDVPLQRERRLLRPRIGSAEHEHEHEHEHDAALHSDLPHGSEHEALERERDERETNGESDEGADAIQSAETREIVQEGLAPP